MLAVRPPPLKAPSQVHVHDVETARPELEVERLGVDDHLISFPNLAHQALVRPGGSVLAVDLDRQRLGLHDHAAA